MNNITVYENGFTFQRINKRQAEWAYNNGLTVIVVPVKCRPFNAWGYTSQINKNNNDNNSFESIMNAWHYYNHYAELGKYPAFYIPVRLNEFDNRPEYDYSYLQ